ncbi:MAG TPA: S41 family peptidase [Verrucomicrobiae bacterium]|nr:S41 family peptidase [Verrucomicrobiae bacterium]
MKRRFLFGLLIAALAANLLIGARIYMNSAEAAQKDAVYPNMKLFSEVMEKVRKDYVDGQNLTYQDLVYGALKGMIDKLDPHSEFLDPERYRELQSDTEGQFGGLGIIVSMKDKFLTVVAPVEDTPGANAGILSGDRIIKIDGTNTEDMSLQDAVKSLRGEPGSEVTITIMRPATDEVKDYKLTRAIINVDMVKDINGKKEFPLGPDKIGYIRLVQFGEKTSDGLEAALDKLKAQGMKALVLDLRWNPGGLLDQAVAVCQKFLPRGQLVVSTEGRLSTQKYFAKGHGDEIPHMPMVVLVNLGSASAAEIVSGCLQDLHRGIVLGEKTFGKGSVQSIIPLEDGSALRLTTAKYYTPSHKVIHEVGITPNVIVPVTDAEERDIVLKRTPGGIESLGPKERAEVENARDPQLDRARDLLRGILLYSEMDSNHGNSRNDRMAALEETAH